MSARTRLAQRLVASLLVGDLDETLAFYEKLGFCLSGCYPDQANPTWVEVRRDDVVLQFYTEPPRNTPTTPACSGTFYIFPESVTALAEELEGELELAWGPEVMDYGVREFGVRDPNGYYLAFTEPADQDRETTDQETIQRLVEEINELWSRQRYDEIGRFLADDVVIAPPGLEGRIRGRDAYVQSYRDYDENATTLEFSAGEPRIDIVESVAVAVCPFDVVYEMEGTRYRERGRDLLVLSRSAGDWKIVWRTMQVDSSERLP